MTVDDRRELLIYGASAASLIGLGIVLRTTLLNWIVGPAFVVAFVVVATNLARHRHNGGSNR